MRRQKNVIYSIDELRIPSKSLPFNEHTLKNEDTTKQFLMRIKDGKPEVMTLAKAWSCKVSGI